MDQYQKYIHLSRYARFIPEENRRETWKETIDRYIAFFKERNADKDIPWDELSQAIQNMEIMPSMRAMMTAGKALERDNMAGFNCTYLPIDHIKAFDETLYVLACGSGVGFSVERQFITKLPEIPDELHPTDTMIVVSDSKIGWASAFRQLIGMLYNGFIPKWDMSKIRPAGARLKTFGGRASGPGPLDDLFKFTVALFGKASGRKLSSIECHDLVCKIADIIVVGGVRRSALLSLSNLTDERMQRAKVGNFWELEPQRQLANISTCYTEKPDMGIFMREWSTLHESGTGERGIFNRVAAKKLSPERRDTNFEFGTNPCCLPETATITTQSFGEVSIKTLVERFKQGESFKVLGYDNGEFVWSEVLGAELTRPDAELLELEIEVDDEIRVLQCTPDHQVLTKNRGYVRADELVEDDEIINTP